MLTFHPQPSSQGRLRLHPRTFVDCHFSAGSHLDTLNNRTQDCQNLRRSFRLNSLPGDGAIQNRFGCMLHKEDSSAMGQLANPKSSTWAEAPEAFILPPEHRPVAGPKSADDDIPVLSLAAFFDAVGEADKKATSASAHWADIAAKVASCEEPAFRRLVADIGQACEEWGFFAVTDHGVPLALLENLQAVGKEFFRLPEAEKRRIGRTFEMHLGYNDSELTKNTRDWKEIFDWASRGFMEMPQSVDSDYRSCKYSEATVKSYNQWPEKPEGFREACEVYTAAVEHLGNILLGLVSASLGLPFNHLHHCFEENTCRARLNYYPQCPLADMVCGVNRHVDSGALTVLAQDDVGGLQVKRRDGEWISVKPHAGAFVVNVGAIFQVWSNDKYRAIEHRAIVNENKERISIPVFCDPDIKTNVAPVPELLDQDHQPPHYQPYNWGFFRRTRNNGNFKPLGENIQIYHYLL